MPGRLPIQDMGRHEANDTYDMGGYGFQLLYEIGKGSNKTVGGATGAPPARMVTSADELGQLQKSGPSSHTRLRPPKARKSEHKDVRSDHPPPPQWNTQELPPKARKKEFESSPSHDIPPQWHTQPLPSKPRKKTMDPPHVSTEPKWLMQELPPPRQHRREKYDGRPSVEHQPAPQWHTQNLPSRRSEASGSEDKRTRHSKIRTSVENEPNKSSIPLRGTQGHTQLVKKKPEWR